MTEHEEIKIIKGTEHPEEFNPELREPPLLSDIQGIVGKYYRECDASNPPKTYLAMEIAEIITQAQREADIKWMKGKCYLKAEREFPPNPWQPLPYAPYYRQFEKYKKDILKKVNGVAFRASREFK